MDSNLLKMFTNSSYKPIIQDTKDNKKKFGKKRPLISSIKFSCRFAGLLPLLASLTSEKGVLVFRSLRRIPIVVSKYTIYPIGGSWLGGDRDDLNKESWNNHEDRLSLFF